MQTLILATDHAAFEAKELLKPFLNDLQLKIIDVGTHSSERCDYADFVQKGVEVLRENPDSLGVFLCGSGIGVSMAANRYKGIRAARCLSVEDAQMTKAHNNANVLCLGARVSSIELMQNMIQAWLDADFEGGRHVQRIEKFNELGH